MTSQFHDKSTFWLESELSGAIAKDSTMPIINFLCLAVFQSIRYTHSFNNKDYI